MKSMKVLHFRPQYMGELTTKNEGFTWVPMDVNPIPQTNQHLHRGFPSSEFPLFFVVGS